jgi:hypothetical protein
MQTSWRRTQSGSNRSPSQNPCYQGKIQRIWPENNGWDGSLRRLIPLDSWSLRPPSLEQSGEGSGNDFGQNREIGFRVSRIRIVHRCPRPSTGRTLKNSPTIPIWDSRIFIRLSTHDVLRRKARLRVRLSIVCKRVEIVLHKTDLLPYIRTQPSMISDPERGPRRHGFMSRGKAHRGADDRCAVADGSGSQGRGCSPRGGCKQTHVVCLADSGMDVQRGAGSQAVAG